MALRLGLQRAVSRASRCTTTRAFSGFQHAADKFSVELPEEHDGFNIEFNWSLAGDDVTPNGDAYRNLRWAKLAEFAKNAKPAGKPVAVKEVDVDVAFGEYEAVYEKVTDFLSLQDNIFAQDGAVGSFKDNRTLTRVISDSALVALFAQNLLVRVPIKDTHAVRHIIVYVATEGEFKGQEPKAFLLADKNEEGEAYVKVVITGDADLASIKDAIGLAKKKLTEHTDAESLILPSDVVLKGDKTALVFNSTDAARAQSANSGSLYSAHLSIWNNAGLTSVFGGALVDAAKTQNSQVVATEKAAAVHVPCNNLVNAPSAALFVTKGSGVKAISTSEAAALLKKVDAAADAEKFEALLKKGDTKAFTVGSEADIEAALAKL